MYHYTTGIDAIDVEIPGIRAATNILILAPSLSHAEIIAYTLSKPNDGEWSVVLSTDERAAEVLDAFKRLEIAKSKIGIIDAITKSSVPNIGDSDKIRFVTSPMDLTGIGIKFSKLVETMWDESVRQDPPGPLPPPLRFCINSLSTLLMYTRPEVIYRFLHVMTARIKKLEGIGIYTLNSDSFEDRTLSTIKQLMNIIIEVKTVDDGISIQHYFRILGMTGSFVRWMRYTIADGKMVIDQ